MTHENLRSCNHCGRHTWYEDDRCPWCHRLITTRTNPVIDVVIIVVCLGALAAMAVEWMT